jgi:hypothetical protein
MIEGEEEVGSVNLKTFVETIQIKERCYFNF